MHNLSLRNISLVVIPVLAAFAGGAWLLLSGSNNMPPVRQVASNLPQYSVAGLEIGVATDPLTPRVGENRLIVELREPNGKPVSVSVEAYAEMPAMGAMQAMRAPAGLKEILPGRYEGLVDLAMRGEWPLTISLQTPQGQAVRLQFDLATDRQGLVITTGATPIGMPASASAESSSGITIDNRRRQMIGVKTAEVTHRDLLKSIRAVGRVTFDERLLSQVSLKFNGYIGDLNADYVGAAITKNQVLFTVYSPELLAAQHEYLAVLKRRDSSTAQVSLLHASRQRLRLWDMSADDISALEQRGVPEDYVAIYAPRSGTLIQRNIADGSAAPIGQTLLTIADLSRVWVEADVFEADLELVKPGMKAVVTLPYLPGRRYPASIEYVYPYLDASSRTGRIRLSLDNPHGELKPDMYAQVSLEVDLGHLLSVVEEAIIVAGDSRVVFVDLDGGRLKPVRIETGRRAQGFVEVLDGLSPGDRVISSGNFLIAAETRLKTGVEQW